MKSDIGTQYSTSLDPLDCSSFKPERYEVAILSKFPVSMPNNWSALLASPSIQRASRRSSNDAHTTSMACRNERDSVILPKSVERSTTVAASTPSLCITDSSSRSLPLFLTSSNQGASIRSYTVIPFSLSTDLICSLPCGSIGYLERSPKSPISGGLRGIGTVLSRQRGFFNTHRALPLEST